MTIYNIKIYENDQEEETIKNLSHLQMTTIKRIFDRNRINYSIKRYDDQMAIIEED